MASEQLPPINTLSLGHTGTSPTTLVAEGTGTLGLKNLEFGSTDSAATSADSSELGLTQGKAVEIIRPDDAVEVAGMHDRLRLKRHEEPVAAPGKSGSVTRNWMDLQREELQAYEYLCHLGEAKEWIEAMIGEHIEDIQSLDDACQRGIILAKLAKSFCPKVVGRIFTGEKLNFRHSDNINYLFMAMREVGLPELFIFELTDAYDKKNIPKVIYAIHALSHLLARKGMGPKIRDLRGQLSFTDDQLRAEKQKMDEAGVAMPSFGSIESSLSKEMKLEEKWNAAYRENLAAVVKVQALWRGKIARAAFERDLAAFREKQRREEEERQRREQKAREEYIEKQRRDALQREAEERERAMRLAREQQERINKKRGDAARAIQAFYRSSRQREMESMRTLSNPALATVRKYLLAADATNNDFADEAELENLKHQVIKLIRSNSATESDLKDMEVKISLLIRNKISLEDVIRTTTKHYREHRGSEAEQGALGDLFGAKTLDKESRQKLEGYQSLFYLLQTQPVYLGKLMFLLNRKWGAAFNNFVEGVVMALFGYAQQNREEYLLLQLIKTAIQFEVREAKEIGDIAKAQPFYVRLLLHYTRAPGQRRYLQQTFQGLIMEVLDAKDMDLDTDILSIYKASIRDEETKTGQKSTRPYNVTPNEALHDSDTNARYRSHLNNLKAFTTKFLDRIIASQEDLPFGIRCILSELGQQLRAKFPAQEAEIDAAIGHVLYYRFMNPAICAPEAYDVVTDAIEINQRRNLAEIGKLLNCVQNGRLSAQDTTLIPLEHFVKNCATEFRKFLADIQTVESAENHFQMDEYLDLTSKPTIAITTGEIYQVHAMLIENIDDLVPNRKDPLAVTLQELGPAPAIGSAGDADRSRTVSLPLINRHLVHSAEGVELTRVWAETKRMIADILATNRATNLVELLGRQTTAADEQRFRDWQRKRAERGEGNAQALSSLDDTKKRALANLVTLEAAKKCRRSNNYQDVVTAIARDIVTKTRRRAQLQQELGRVRQTIGGLQQRSQYLQEQKQSYNDYIASCTAQLSNNRHRMKKAPLFSKQYWHVKNLEKSGRMPKFGSYKYTAEELRVKGVLEGVEGYTPKQYGGMSLVISSNQPGVFLIDCSYMGVKLAEQMELRIEELLQQQNEGVRQITLFDVAKVNVNLLLFLINKRFFA
ncbi:hypothetical protein DFJ74DRAFT_352748 [Hyaloraphidium curvatum]|nr:hypothetical protein DFJ74DRAFT_352748 [Hyaloraphidium curvatum]